MGKTNVVIIGAGKMGKAHANLISRSGCCNVVCYDSDESVRKSLAGTFRVADTVSDALRSSATTDKKEHTIILLLTPASELLHERGKAQPSALVEEIAHRINPGTIVVSGTSVMSPIAKELTAHLKGKDIEILGAHCLFSNSVNDFGYNNLALVHISEKAETMEIVKNLFKSSFANGIECVDAKLIGTSDRHDKIMADVQFLPHFMYISSASTWAETGITPYGRKDITQEGSLYPVNIDEVKWRMMLRILSGSVSTYESIAMLNPYSAQVARIYAMSVLRLHTLACSGHTSRFMDTMRPVRDYLYGSSGTNIPMSALNEISGIVNAEKEAFPNSQLALLGSALTRYRLRKTIIDVKAANEFSTAFSRVFDTIMCLVLSDAALKKEATASRDSPELRIQDGLFVENVRRLKRAVVKNDSKSFVQQFSRASELFVTPITKSMIMRMSDELIEKLSKILRPNPNTR